MADPVPIEGQQPPQQQAPLPDLGPEPVSSRAPAEPAPPAEGQQPPAEGGEGGEPKMVKLEALHEERQRRRAAEDRARSLEANFQTLDQRLSQLQNLAQQPVQPKLPDPKTDPIGFTVEALPMLSKQVNEVQRGLTDAQERQLRAERAQQFVTRVAQEHAAFTQRQPDADAAVAFLRQRKIAEYTAVGMSDADAAARLQQDEATLALTSIQRGENPYEVAYRAANALGYKPSANGNGQQMTDADRARMQAQGRQAATPGGGAGAGGGKPTLETLLKMSRSDFDKATQGDNWRRLMTGQ